MTRVRLENGITLLVWAQQGMKTAAVSAWVSAGTIDELPGEHGSAHMLEHMLFKGTAKLGVGEIARVVESAGGEINAWTTHDHTVFQVLGPASIVPTGIEILGEALLAPRLPADELERERGVLVQEVTAAGDDAERLVVGSLLAEAFPGHPYARPVAGTLDDVRGLTLPALRGFHRRNYQPGRITVVVAGDVDVAQVIAAVKARFGSVKPRKSTVSRPPTPAPTGPHVTVLARGVGQAQLALGFRIPGVRAADAAALDAVAAMLAQGEGARLRTAARRGASLADATAYTWTPGGDGLLVVRGRVSVGLAVEDAARELYEQVFAFVAAPPGEDELIRAKRRLEAGALWARETAEGLARQLGWFESVAGDAAYQAAYLEAVRALTPASVRAAAERHLREEHLAVAALVPRAAGVELDDRLARRLAKLAGEEDRRARALAEVAPRGEVKIERRVLASGVRVLVERDTSLPLVAARAVWSGGQRLEDDSRAGIHRLLAGALVRGCGDYSADEISREMDILAGTLAGFSGRSSFGASLDVPKGGFPRALELLASCARDPRFPEDELARQRRATEDARRARNADPAALAFRMLDERMFRGRAFGLDPLGATEKLAQTGSDELVAFHRTHYPLAGLVLAVVGDVEPAEVFAAAEKLFPAVRGSAAAPPATQIAPPVPRERTLEVYLNAPIEQAHLVIGFPGAALADADRFALDVVAALLAGQGGRLFDSLRERRGLAYHVSAFSFESLEPGYLAIHVVCAPDHLATVRAEIDAQLALLRDVPVGEEELARARRWLHGGHAQALERRADRASALALGEAHGLGADASRRWHDLVSGVTAADVQAAARRHLDWSHAVVSVVQPRDLTPAAALRASGKKMKAPPPPRAKRKAAPR